MSRNLLAIFSSDSWKLKKIEFKMKWIALFLVLGFGLTSCLNDDNRPVNVYYQYRPIDSVEIGAINGVMEVTEIKTYFTASDSCEGFFDYDYSAMGPIRKVALITSKVEGQNCAAEPFADYSVLRFRPASRGEYTFLFWKANDEDGYPVYFEKKIYIP